MSQPLKDIRIAITRSAEQMQSQREMLAARGADVVLYPCIEILPPADLEPLDQALTKAAAGDYEWLILTSANTVRFLAQRMNELGIAPSSLTKLQIAVVGSSTGNIVKEELSLTPRLMPDIFTAEKLGEALSFDAEDRILLPQSALAKRDLSAKLSSRGAAVTSVEAYRTVVAQGGDDLPVMLWEGSVDAVTFTSVSTVRFFNRRLAGEQGTLAMLDGVCIACIGPATAAAARSLGLRVTLTPAEHTISGLTDALVEFFGG